MKAFQANMAKLEGSDTQVLGVSVDSPFANHAFAMENGITFPILGDMTAFQWVMYYGDRPAYELAAAAILQGFFNRFPNVKLLLSEQGTVWVPYFVRKMDHAALLGRRSRPMVEADLDGR